MDCPSCGHPNAPGARFCGDCGSSLSEAISCPACGAANPAGQRFCNSCGGSLGSAAPASPIPRADGAFRQAPDHLAEKIRAGGRALEGERKQVTVLFADVMGSMELAERTDPEQWQGLMDSFFAILSEGVHLFEGTVDKFTGDGIMAVFGAPIAHEDHAQRACFAALQLIDRLSEFAAELRRTRGLNFLVRIGINSGEVVVGGIGEDLGMEYTAVGHTVGLAQRMEVLAEPGKAYLTEQTAELVQGYLALEDLGQFEVKGASRPLRVYELTGVGPARGRLDISQARGFSRFVGRDEEMAELEAAFEQAKSGEGQVIGIVGEPGVGKSRLCHEFTQRWRSKGVPVYHTGGQPHTKSVPLMPVMELMRTYFDITEQDSDQRARERIAGKLLLLDRSLVDDLPMLFDFLGVPDPENPAPGMDPEARRRQLMALTKRLIRAQSDREAGINLFEDLHWLDPATETFLANHVDAVQGTKSLTILNFRPEYHSRWMSKPYYRQIPLFPLSPEAIAEMLDDLLGRDPSLAELPAILNERTGGNPFFIEEVMRSLIEAGNLEGERGAFKLVRPVEESVVPASVQVVLAARIDRLAQRDKEVLQAAAVIGKEFSESVLSRVAGLERPELEDSLRELVTAGFVYEQEIYPESIYAFKHPLTQEVAYGSQLGGRREADHAAVARAIADLYPERLEERAALLAHHWEAAAETAEAARWHARAATWSGTRDPRQSIHHWRKVAELSDSLPESEETVALGLGSRIFQLQYCWRLGISEEDTSELFEEAERLASKAGNIHARAVLLSVYSGIKAIIAGSPKAGGELAAQAFALAEETGDPTLYISIAGSSYVNFLLGDFDAAVAVVDRALELADGDQEIAAGTTVGCPYGYCLVFKGGYVSCTGELDRGRALIDEGIEICGEHGDIETVGWGHMWSFWIAYWSGEPDLAISHAQRALDIAERLGDSFSRTWAWLFFGGAQVMQGRWEQGVDALERSISLSDEHRTAVDSRGWAHFWLAEAHLGRGDAKAAVDLARKGLEIAKDFELPVSDADGHLVLARALLAGEGLAATAEVEEALGHALAVCQEIGFRTLEPLVHAELAELARRRGDDVAHARELGEAHRLFTEISARGHAERLAGELSATAG